MTRIARRTFLRSAAALALAGRAAAEPRPRPSAAWSASADAARRLDQLHALVIVHRGETAFAEAFRGPSPDRPVNVKSVSKSFVAALTGAALDRGEIPGLDATLGELAPRLIPAGADPRVAEITVADLVTMQAGLERTSGPPTAAGCRAGTGWRTRWGGRWSARRAAGCSTPPAACTCSAPSSPR